MDTEEIDSLLSGGRFGYQFDVLLAVNDGCDSLAQKGDDRPPLEL